MISDNESLNSNQAKKIKWSISEDKLLTEAIKTHGIKSWNIISTLVPGRTGKQCRERWLGQLNPNISKSHWSMNEDVTLVQCQQYHGNKWSNISKILPGRSPISVKNRWSWLVRHGIPQKILQIESGQNNLRLNQKQYFLPLEASDSSLFGPGFLEFQAMLNIK